MSVCLVVDNTGSQSYRTCTGVGPNYIRTFDGLEYLFPGRCHYTVFSDGLRVISVKYINCHSYQQCRKVHYCDLIHFSFDSLMNCSILLPSRRLCFIRHLSTCLLATLSKNYTNRIFVKIFPVINISTRTNWVNFGRHIPLNPDVGIF